MNTAVQLRRTGAEVRSGLLYGTPVTTVAGTLGPVALFSSGKIVAYRIRHRRRTRLFVFRTLDVDDRLAARIPGVCPRVQLLLEVRSAGRARLVRGLLAYLVKTRHDPCRLRMGSTCGSASLSRGVCRRTRFSGRCSPRRLDRIHRVAVPLHGRSFV